ncbi:MAG TPA: hypothetical protein VM328_04720 [Fimbriimonadaceae bacterium]|nr:hypothetical protein [Fimbriimonadaceae bacterium]
MEPSRRVLRSDRLLGLKSDCNIPGCPEWEASTGWLVFNEAIGRHFVEFECPRHGPSATWRPEWRELIESLLESPPE